MLRFFISVVVAMLVTATSVCAQQPSRLDDIIKRGTLRVGMTGDYAPFSYLDKATSTFRGFDVDMAEALGTALGVKVEYIKTSWPELMKDFEDVERHRHGALGQRGRNALGDIKAGNAFGEFALGAVGKGEGDLGGFGGLQIAQAENESGRGGILVVGHGSLLWLTPANERR